MQLAGIHHLTAVTAQAKRNIDFYTRVLGLRLVKKTVNQDDTSAYHLFYADGKGSPGTDITFFDWPARRERRGTRSIVRTGFRVGDKAALEFWRDRFTLMNVTQSDIVERDGRDTLDFEDFEGQRLTLVKDDSTGPVNPWAKSLVPEQFQMRGFGPITISVPVLASTEALLTGVMNMKRVREYKHRRSDAGDETVDVVVFTMGDGGAAAELHVAVEPNAPKSTAGAGGAHHVAFRVPTFEEYDAWSKRLGELAVPTSGPVDRFYFRSLYFKEPNGVLFELATDEPGFDSDEPMESLGEKLSLPPFLEPKRVQIEAGLKPL